MGGAFGSGGDGAYLERDRYRSRKSQLLVDFLDGGDSFFGAGAVVDLSDLDEGRLLRQNLAYPPPLRGVEQGETAQRHLPDRRIFHHAYKKNRPDRAIFDRQTHLRKDTRVEDTVTFGGEVDLRNGDSGPRDQPNLQQALDTRVADTLETDFGEFGVRGQHRLRRLARLGLGGRLGVCLGVRLCARCAGQ